MSSRPNSIVHMTKFDRVAAWVLALAWIFPLAYAVWTSIHPAEYSTRFDLFAPITLDNFVAAWNAAPFAQYLLNTFILVSIVIVAQFIVCTLAAYAFARFDFPFKNLAFFLVFVQLLILPEVLISENFRTISAMGLTDTIISIGLPYIGSAFGIFLLRQTFKTVPLELEQAARVEGTNVLQTLWLVYVPLAKPVYLAYGLVLVSYHWNNLLWPLIVTNSVDTRPITVGLQVFAQADQGVDWGIITAATLITSAPLLIAFLIFQSLFVQSFMRAGIK